MAVNVQKVVQCGRHTVFVDGLSNVSTAGLVSIAFRVGQLAPARSFVPQTLGSVLEHRWLLSSPPIVKSRLSEQSSSSLNARAIH